MSDNKKLIIFTHGGGRFTNQLISYSHLIAFILENQDEFNLINMAFWPYAHLLEIISKEPLCIFPSQHNKLKQLKILRELLAFLPARISNRIRANTIRALYAYGSVFPGVQSLIVQDASGLKYCIGEKKDCLDLANSDDVSLFNQTDITLLAGWNIRSWSLFKKHQYAILKYLALRWEYNQTAKKFIESLRDKYDLLIGILIRQGDYRIFSEGKYYFDTARYIQWMLQAKEIFGISSKLGFVIASDEQQDWEKFNNLEVHFTTGIAGGKGHFIESMLELSQCDLIMTPPSTFGVWAAFVGNIPVLPLCEATQMISSSDLLENHIFDAIAHPHMSVAVN